MEDGSETPGAAGEGGGNGSGPDAQATRRNDRTAKEAVRKVMDRMVISRCIEDREGSRFSFTYPRSAEASRAGLLKIRYDLERGMEI